MNNKKINASKFRIPKTLSQSIYEHLKESILNKELEPNQRINEQEIADSFDVSRTPVREAVVRLAAEGFVDIVSHREALVKEVSYKELKEVFQVIGVLDRLAVHLIVDKIDSHELTKLEKLTSKMERHFIMREVEKFLDLNYSIHENVVILYILIGFLYLNLHFFSLNRLKNLGYFLIFVYLLLAIIHKKLELL